ncbi:MAG: EAL domain-containing protein [Clostridiales bacterium]|nr:EAL domain-containing protein [Clostridiales bacterium]
MKKILKVFFSSRYIKALRNAIVLVLPVILIGSFAYMLSTLPLEIYQNFIRTFARGFFYKFFSTIYIATINSFSLIMLIAISYCYEKLLDIKARGMLVLVSLAAYISVNIDFNHGLSEQLFSKTSLLDVIFTVYIADKFFLFFQKHIFGKHETKSYTRGSDDNFLKSINSILPMLIIIIVCATLNVLVFKGNAVTIQENLSALLISLFNKLGCNFISGLLYVFLVHIFWFIGFHGESIMQSVGKDYFSSLVTIDGTPIIMSKTFFNTFVLIGGCGIALSFLIAVFIAEKRKTSRKFCKMAAFPALFNINEIILYGFPIAFNPVYFIPFVVAPIVTTIVSYIAFACGVVPPITNNIEWTTPVFLSGYIATGSVWGSILQLVNLGIGVLIYIPFIKLDNKKNNPELKEILDEIVDYIKECEHLGDVPCLSNLTGPLGYVSNMLIEDFLHDFNHNENIKIHYQLQVNYDNTIFGVEALLRWKNKHFGYMYPPLTIAIAQETGMLDELSYLTISQVAADSEAFSNIFDEKLCVSLNFNAIQLENPQLVPKIKEIVSQYKFHNIKLGVEITEQYELANTEEMMERLDKLRDMGADIIMDDFGMGYSSLVNLQNNHYDMVKLDGALVKDILTNSRSRDIISSIIYMSKNMGFTVLAEYVETNEQREKLNELGCTIYQGYYFSKALPFEEAVDLIAEKYSTK